MVQCWAIIPSEEHGAPIVSLVYPVGELIPDGVHGQRIGTRVSTWRFHRRAAGGDDHRAEEARARLREFNAEPGARMEAIRSFVSHHCIGLAGEHYHVQRTVNGADHPREQFREPE